MLPNKILATVIDLATLALIVWFFWTKKRVGLRAIVNRSGYQEVMVVVKGGYTPSVKENPTPTMTAPQASPTSTHDHVAH